MFSHLCRCCLTVFSSSSEIVPLFERQKNIWYHRLITAAFRVSLTKNDNLGTNICKSCAIEVLKSYKFRLKYIESERSLRKMLDQTEKKPNRYEALFDVEVTVDESASVSQASIPPETAYFRWKCNKCTASFRSRSQYRDHRRVYHHNKNYHYSAEFGTKKLKLKHEADQPSENDPFHEPEIVIEDYGSANDDFVSPNAPEMDVDSVKDEFRFIDQEPDLDLGLYLIEKHSQINNFDPLEVDNFSDSLLTNPSYDINNKWKCGECAASFRTRNLLSEHRHLHVASKPRPRLQVKKFKKAKVRNSPNAKDAKQFVDESVNAPKWQCKTCLFSFDSRELLRIHWRQYLTKNGKTGRKEMQCIGETRGVDGLSKKKNVPKWQCHMCLFSFETREMLRIHRRDYSVKNEKTGRRELQCIEEKRVDDGL